MSCMNRRGTALVTVLLMTVVLLTMVKLLVYLATSQSARSQNHYRRMAALCAVQAGVTDALNELAKNKAWADGFDAKPLTRMEATYTVRFNAGGPVGELESVNNLESDLPADGFRGDESVPSRAVELVVVGRSGAVERTVRIVAGELPATASSVGMTAGGNILLRGNVVVEGFTTLGEGSQPVPTHVQSNRPEAAPDIIRWAPLSPGDRAVVAGDVRTVSSDVEAIDFGTDATAYQVDAMRTGAPVASGPRLDVASEVAAHVSDPAPTINPLAANQLTSGSYYHAGDLTINGDLDLDETDLYVGGNLTVNGSITGKGSLHVAGDTAFQGDAQLYTTGAQGVALFSEGSVSLTGLDGTEYMEALAAADPQAALWWTDATETLSALQVAGRNAIANQELTTFDNDYGRRMRRVLGTDLTNGSQTWQGRTPDAVGKLQALLQTRPPSTTRDFMLERLDYMQWLFADDTDNPYTPGHTGSQIRADWASGGNQLYGVLDAVLGGSPNADRERLLQTIFQMDYQRLGSAYFQGSVYTNGFVYAANEVTIVGTLTAAGERNGTPVDVGGEPLLPGDIFLDNDCRLTFVQDFEAPEDDAADGSQEFYTRSWVEI